MKIELEVNSCYECPYCVYTHEGYQCNRLPLKESFVIPEGRDKVVDRCPIKKKEE